MWKAQEMDLVPIVKTLIRALVNHRCWWSQDWRVGHSRWSFWCTTSAFCSRSGLWSCQQQFCSIVGRSGTARCVGHSTFRYRATAVDLQRPQRVAVGLGVESIEPEFIGLRTEVGEAGAGDILGLVFLFQGCDRERPAGHECLCSSLLTPQNRRGRTVLCWSARGLSHRIP